MSLDFPWQMFLNAQDMKNQNQQNMWQNIAGIGQGVGDTGGAIGGMIQQNRMKQLLQMLQQQGQGNGMGGGSQMPNPFAQSMGQQTTLANGPLSMMGNSGGFGNAGGGWQYMGKVGQ